MGAASSGHVSALVGLVFVALSVFEGYRARAQRHVRAGRLLAASFFVFAIAVLCYPPTLARVIDHAVGTVDVAHLVSMVGITTTVLLLFRLTTEVTPSANVPLRGKWERLVWALLGVYTLDWIGMHFVTPRLTEDMIYAGYFARPPLVGILNALAGITFIIAGACASYGFWVQPKPTQAERLTVGAIRLATVMVVVYGAAVLVQTLLSALGQPQSIHRWMVPLGLLGVAVALFGSAAFTDGLRVGSWTRRLSGPRAAPLAAMGPVNELVSMQIFLDDHMLAARGAVKGLLDVVNARCVERGLDEERTKIALQATRVGILDFDGGSPPYDRTIHQMCHYARRNDRFIGNVYRVVLATLGPGTLPVGQEMPQIEPWHEELAALIRDAVYAYFGPERGRNILANQGIVTRSA